MRKYRTGSTGVPGVYKCRDRFYAVIKYNDRYYYLGRFDTVEDAGIMRKSAENHMGDDFLRWYENDRSGEGDAIRAKKRRSKKALEKKDERDGKAKIFKNNTSGVNGVSKWGDKYRVNIFYKKKQYSLGYFDTIEEAAEMRAEADSHKNGDFLEWYSTSKVADRNRIRARHGAEKSKK